MFKNISLSPNTIATRIEELSHNTHDLLIAKIKKFRYFSIAIDESVCRTDTAFCAVFIRGVDSDLIITEELLDLIPLKSNVTGRNLFDALEVCLLKCCIDLSKMVSVTTDGAPAMCSKNVG